ncbi:hypothetical protein H4S06_005479 [Coemansia sp. BCRC 34490]|nr:hypothetical protein H4S06_005479 [Coemansia sp. BCRC 34490]
MDNMSGQRDFGGIPDRVPRSQTSSGIAAPTNAVPRPIYQNRSRTEYPGYGDPGRSRERNAGRSAGASEYASASEYAHASGRRPSYSSPRDTSGPPQAPGNQLNTTSEADIDTEFYNLVDYISQLIRRLDDELERVKSGYQAVLSASTDRSREECTRRRDDQIQATTKAISKINKGLKRLEEMKQLYARNPSISSSQIAMRAAKQQSLAKAFGARLEKYKEIGRDYSELYKSRLRRQYEIANPEATRDEVEDALDNDTAANAFAQAIKSSRRLDDANFVLRNVDQRKDDIIKIEETMRSLSELSQEISQMVIKQQEQIDSIENAVEEAHGYTVEGVKEVQKATEYVKKSRKMKWCLLILAILVAVAIGVGLYFKFRK